MSAPSTELEDALRLADKLLDVPMADPDDDLRVLSRQLIRAHDSIVRIQQERLTWAIGCQCDCDACEDLSSIIRQACFQSEPPEYQGSITDSEDVPR